MDQIDVDDVRDREYFHMVLKNYVLTLLFIEVNIAMLHSIASLYFVKFHIANPICFLLGVEIGWAVYKRFSTRFLQRELMKLLSTIVLIVVVLPVVITPDNVLPFILKLLDVSQFASIVTMFLLLFLLLVFM